MISCKRESPLKSRSSSYYGRKRNRRRSTRGGFLGGNQATRGLTKTKEESRYSRMGFQYEKSGNIRLYFGVLYFPLFSFFLQFLVRDFACADFGKMVKSEPQQDERTASCSTLKNRGSVLRYKIRGINFLCPPSSFSGRDVLVWLDGKFS